MKNKALKLLIYIAIPIITVVLCRLLKVAQGEKNEEIVFGIMLGLFLDIIFFICLTLKYGNPQKPHIKETLYMDFPFYDAPDTAAIICCHIINDGKPILYVSHDEDDGMWQFLCGATHGAAEARLVSLKSVFDLDHSVSILKDMPCGCYAERKTQKDNWIIKRR